MKKIILLLLLTPFLCLSQFKIKGNVLSKGLPLEYANVIISTTTDVFIKGTMTDEKGNFEIEIEKGVYKISITEVNHETYFKEVTINENIFLKDIDLKLKENLLNEVIIKSDKKRITRKIDRIVFNIENNPITSGGNAVDALKSSPGLIMKNNEIAMLGKNGVKVMIEGKILELSGEDLKNFLSSISANDIKEIEIITNPPSKYDASGNSGMVNIIYKKGRKNSWNNNISYTHSQAKFGRETLNNSFSYQKDKVNILLNLGYDYGLINVEQRAEMFFTEKTMKLTSIQKNKINDFSSRFIFDYKLNNRTKIGLQYLGGFRNKNFDDEIITKFVNNSEVLDSYLLGVGGVKDKNNNHTFNFHLDKKIDTLGRNMFFDVDFLKFKTNKNNNIFSREFSSNDSFLGVNFANEGDSDQDIINYNAKIDFEHPLKFANLSYGAKFSFTKTKYTLNSYDLISGEPIFNPLQSNSFEFDESIQALYVSGTKKINEKWETQFGFRTEYTQTRGSSITSNQENKNDYIKIFPTLYLKYSANENNQYLLSYGRRIDRPNYGQLNPARYFISSQVSSMGNPYLQPSYNENIEFSHTYKNNLTTKLGLNITSNAYNTVPTLNDSTNEQIVTFENFFSNYSYSLLETYQFNLYSWWRSDLTLFLNYSESKKTNDKINLKLNNGFEFYGGINNALTLNKSKTITGEINYGYGSPFKSNLYEYSQYSNLDIALSFKSILKKLNLTTGIYDVFNSSPRMSYSEFNGIKQNYISYPSNRYFRVSLIYSFGNDKVSTNERNFGNESERNRSN